MFCPVCKAEYRFGFIHCPDCDVDLVEHLPEPDRSSDGQLSDEKLQEVWAGDQEEECVSICEKLGAARIPFKVNQRHHQVFKRVDSSFRIGVPPNFCDQAEEIIGNDHVDAADQADDQRATELPPEDDIVTAPDLEHEDWDPDNWHPEDATVEVWSENAEQETSMIESSLRENRIHTRTEVLDDGPRKFFVMPEDEARARGIVREIKDGTPP